MRVDKKLTNAFLTILPSLQSYVTPEETLYTKLLKALYGCIQSGQLWYANIWKVLLLCEGYTLTPTNPCIFRQHVNNKFYVCDKVQSYLGMNIEIQEHAIVLLH
jgi:hypothetical protein